MLFESECVRRSIDAMQSL